MKGLFQCPPRATPWVIMDVNKSPCKGKSFINLWYFKAFALTGRFFITNTYPGRCPGLGGAALTGRMAITSLG